MQSKNASYYLGLNSRHFEVNSSNWGLCLLSWFLLCKQLGEEVTYVRRALWKVKCSVKSKVLLFAKELYTWRNICRLWGADCSAGSCLADTKERNVGEELGHMAVVALPLVAPRAPPPFFSMITQPSSTCSKFRDSGYRIRTGPHCWDPLWPSGSLLSPQSRGFLTCKSLDLLCL